MTKKIIAFILLLAFVFACSKRGTPTGKTTGAITDPSESKGLVNFKYLAYMYDSANGAELNNIALSGALFDLYRTQLQDGLNLSMKFPYQSNEATKAFKSGTTPWYNSISGDVNQFIQQAGYDITAGIILYLASPQGQAFINQELDKIQAQIHEAIDYGFDKVEPYLQGALIIGGVFAVGYIANAFATTNNYFCFIQNIDLTPTLLMNAASVATIASAVVSYFQNQAIIAKLDQIISMLEKVQESLNRIEGKIDNLIVMEIQDKHKDFDDALTALKSIYNLLKTFPVDDIAKKKETLYKVFFEGIYSYQYLMDRAYESAKNTAYWLKQNNKIEDQEAIGIELKRYYSSAVFNIFQFMDTVKFSFKMPLNYLNISLQDLQGMARLSKARLSFYDQIFTDNELLKFKAKAAEVDLEKLLEIKENLNQVPQKIKETLKEEKYQITFSSANAKSVLTDKNQNITQDFYRNSYQYGLNLTCAGEVGCFISDPQPKSNFDKILQDSLEYALNLTMTDNKFKDYLIAYALELAQWEIELRAHIKAAENI